ncbi:MAG: hypothetical protein ACFFFT_05440 [Candidatus Thorarchaeota archaeon]
MIENVWTVICQRSVVDKDTNNLSIFDVLEQFTITAPKLPKSRDNKKTIIPLSFEVISFWIKKNMDHPETGTAKLTFKAPNGNQEEGAIFDINLQKHKRFRSKIKVAGIPFYGSGEYVFIVYLKNEKTGKWKEVSKVPIEIIVNIVKNSI